MTDTDTLELVGIVPLLADEVFAAADAPLRLHFGGRALAAGDDISVAEAQAPPRVDIDGEGVFTLVAVSLGSRGAQTLVWCVCNIPDFEFGLGEQVVSYRGPSPAEAPCRLVFLLYRQRGDEPLDMYLTHTAHKFNAAAAPTDQAGLAERRGFDAKQLAAQYRLGLPVAVHWVGCQPSGP